jgi:acyl-coenzyme A synthetase/AMP-(fatty) acid ligase
VTERLSAQSIMPGFRPGGTLVWRNGEAISHARFIGQVAAVARAIPNCRCAVNLCEDRYCFLLALCACLIRGARCLLPPDRLSNTIAEIASTHPETLLIADKLIPDLPPDLTRPLWTLTESEAPEADLSVLPKVPADRDCLVAFTSGSTGKPQPHPKRWGDLMLGATLAARRFGIRPESTVVATVPPQHMYGLELSILVPLALGAATTSARPFFPEDLRRVLDEVAPPRILVTTPVHLAACARSGLDWPAIDFVISATAPLAPELAGQAEKRLRAPVYEIYGCTEAGSMASRRTCDGPAWRWYDTVTVDRDGPGVSIRADFLPGPVPLVDCLEFDADGRFRLVGRAQDMVKVAGKRASLGDLNLKLAGIPGVIDGVFIAPRGDGPKAQRLAAVVVAPGLDRDSLLRELRRLIDPAFLPRPLVFADALPRNAAGKLPRDALLEFIRPGGGGLAC